MTSFWRPAFASLVMWTLIFVTSYPAHAKTSATSSAFCALNLHPGQLPGQEALVTNFAKELGLGAKPKLGEKALNWMLDRLQKRAPVNADLREALWIEVHLAKNELVATDPENRQARNQAVTKLLSAAKSYLNELGVEADFADPDNSLFSRNSLRVRPSVDPRFHWLAQLAGKLASFPIPADLYLVPPPLTEGESRAYLQEDYPTGLISMHLPALDTVSMTDTQMNFAVTSTAEHELYHFMQLQIRALNPDHAWPDHLIGGTEDLNTVVKSYYALGGYFNIEEIGAYAHQALVSSETAEDRVRRLKDAFAFSESALVTYHEALLTFDQPFDTSEIYSVANKGIFKVKLADSKSITIVAKSSDLLGDQRKFVKDELERGLYWVEAYHKFLSALL